MAPKSAIKNDPQQIVDRLAEIIRQKGLAKGDRLPSIRDLATMMKVSPSVIRDAMVRAQAIGVVKLSPRSGVFVESVNYAPALESLTTKLPRVLQQLDQNIIYLLDTRRILEIESVALAAERRHIEDLVPVRQALNTMNQIVDHDQLSDFVSADIDFHLAISRAAGNPVLYTLLKALFECIEPFLMSSYLGLPWNQERRTRTLESHQEIYVSIFEQNVERARRAIDDHLSLAREKLIDEIHKMATAGA